MTIAASLTGRISEHRPTAATPFHSMITRAMASMKKHNIIRGVGINDATYSVTRSEKIDGKHKIVWRCPFYLTWNNMLNRCYSESYLATYPTYREVTVCPDWLVFSHFKAWMEKQDWKGKQLDKDLLIEGNKVYSPDGCIFVESKINSFIIDSSKSRGSFLIGVDWFAEQSKFRCFCSNPFTGKKEYLGLFADELTAHLAWKKRKHELACQLVETCTDARLSKALEKRYAA